MFLSFHSCCVFFFHAFQWGMKIFPLLTDYVELSKWENKILISSFATLAVCKTPPHLHDSVFIFLFSSKDVDFILNVANEWKNKQKNFQEQNNRFSGGYEETTVKRWSEKETTKQLILVNLAETMSYRLN